MHALWKKPTWLSALGATIFLTVDAAFLAANANKIAHGGWFPLLVGLLMFAALSTWKRGRETLVSARVEKEGPLQGFVDELHAMDPAVARVPGTGVYLNARPETTPLALRAGLQQTQAMHEAVVILSISTARAPHVPEADRLVIDELGYEDDGISHITARFGFQDHPDVPRILALAREAGLETEIDVERAFYFLSHVEIVPRPNGGMQMWRKRLFVAMARNAASPIEYFKLPRERTLTIGSAIEL